MIIFFYKTAFCLAVERRNIEIINLLVKDERLDASIPRISF